MRNAAEGRVALVTGASQGGTGTVAAIRLAAEGAKVAITARSVDGLERTRAEIETLGGIALVLPCDLAARDGGRDTLVARTEADLGPVDILVNNAGNAGAPGMVVSQFREMDPALWDRFVAVNLYGVLNCSRAVIDGMCERGWGRVITISSGAGVIGMRMGISIYAAAKSGSIGFMRHLAMEVARQGVTANTLALGLMGVQELTELTRDTARQIPVGRLGSPEDVGAACAYLASEEAAWMTGQTINLNGGATTT
jgi:NAD(P)-dependent dehydrogenase (short-subunit alcohol dehydrogenase family)